MDSYNLFQIFLTDKEFKKISSYKFLLNLGIFDCLQLCFHWTAGILVMYPELCDYTYFCKVALELSSGKEIFSFSEVP